ncbi:MAG: hypothetical protein ABSH33_15365 [Steroidobacteraceae bacterium]
MQTARRKSRSAGLMGRHCIVYCSRTFPLRVGIEEFASSLGILNPPDTAQPALSRSLDT